MTWPDHMKGPSWRKQIWDHPWAMNCYIHTFSCSTRKIRHDEYRSTQSYIMTNELTLNIDMKPPIVNWASSAKRYDVLTFITLMFTLHATKNVIHKQPIVNYCIYSPIISVCIIDIIVTLITQLSMTFFQICCSNLIGTLHLKQVVYYTWYRWYIPLIYIKSAPTCTNLMNWVFIISFFCWQRSAICNNF